MPRFGAVPILLCVFASFAAGVRARESEADGRAAPAGDRRRPVLEAWARQARPGAAYWVLAAGVHATSTADWVTTRAFLRDGVSEANPLMAEVVANPAGFAAIKLAGGTLVNRAGWELRQHGRRWWWIPQASWMLLNAAASAHNLNAAD